MAWNRLFGCFFALLVVGVVSSASNATDAQDKRKAADAQDKRKAQRVLERMAGAWETEAVSTPSRLAPKEFKAKSTIVREWVLGGQFIQEKIQSTETEDGQCQGLSIIGYDPWIKAFRCWFFDLGGDWMEQIGQWDEATKTMTWKGELEDGTTVISLYRFVDNNTIEWQGTGVQKDGNLYFHVEGTSTRMNK